MLTLNVICSFCYLARSFFVRLIFNLCIFFCSLANRPFSDLLGTRYSVSEYPPNTLCECISVSTNTRIIGKVNAIQFHFIYLYTFVHVQLYKHTGHTHTLSLSLCHSHSLVHRVRRCSKAFSNLSLT